MPKNQLKKNFNTNQKQEMDEVWVKMIVHIAIVGEGMRHNPGTSGDCSTPLERME